MPHRCSGVASLSGRTVVFTGRVYMRDQFMTQDECAKKVARRGGTPVQNSSPTVDIVVHGELVGNVIAPRYGWSQKLVDAYERSRKSDHVHVIDGDGLARLLRGQRAKCLGLKRKDSGEIVAELGPEVLGGPLRARKWPKSSGRGLAADLDALDRATAAHEATVEALRVALSSAGYEPRGPARGRPRFDGGWEDKRGNIWIAEVKSLPYGNEAQQIRLGIGQLLDYAWSLEQRGDQVKLALVLERRPNDSKWAKIAKANRILLTSAPDFTELRLPKGRTS